MDNHSKNSVFSLQTELKIYPIHNLYETICSKQGYLKKQEMDKSSENSGSNKMIYEVQ